MKHYPIDSTTCATSPTTKTVAGCEPATCRAISPASPTSPSPSFASRGASIPSPKPTGTTPVGPGRRTPAHQPAKSLSPTRPRTLRAWPHHRANVPARPPCNPSCRFTLHTTPNDRDILLRALPNLLFLRLPHHHNGFQPITCSSLHRTKFHPGRPRMWQVIIACVNSSALKEVAFVARTLTTARLKRQNARQCLLPGHGRRNIGDVNRRDNELMVETLTRVRRNRMRALISPLLRLFETLEWRSRNSSPTHDVERARGEAWNRVLSVAELEALASALTDAAQRHPYAVAAVRFATLAGLRTGEILGVQWDHVQIDSGRLLLPAKKACRRMHDQPPAALEVRSALPRNHKWCLASARDAATAYCNVRTVIPTANRAAGLPTYGGTVCRRRSWQMLHGPALKHTCFGTSSIPGRLPWRTGIFAH